MSLSLPSMSATIQSSLVQSVDNGFFRKSDLMAKNLKDGVTGAVRTGEYIVSQVGFDKNKVVNTMRNLA
jgi:hypothetical protein